MKYEKKVSICMMIKNEEKNLDRCLKSLQPIINAGVGELIIVDTGSEDSSVEIAKKYTDRVFKHSWTNNFSDMRNISISYARGEWIWIMDADEEIENPYEAVKLFQSDLSKYNTISIKMKNYMSTKKDNEESDYNVCILNRGFRNTKDFKYEGRIHEQPNIKPPFLHSNIIFGHYGYIWEDKEFRKKKYDRTTEILRMELEKNPNNIYYQFQLAVSCAVVNYEEGLIQMRKAYELAKKLPYKEKAKYVYIYGIYAKIAYANKKYAEIIKICKEGLEISNDYIDLWYYLGLANVAIGDEEQGLKSFGKYLKCKEGFGNTRISKDPAFTFYSLDDASEQSAIYNICVIYVNKEDYSQVLGYLSKLKTSELKSKIVARVNSEQSMQNVLVNYLEEIKDKEDIMLRLIELLENQKRGYESKINLAKIIIEFYSTHDKHQDDYYLLNTIRVSMAENKRVNKEIEKKLVELNYNELPSYYGDIFAYIIKYNFDFASLKVIGDPNNVGKFIKYLEDYFENIHKDVTLYLNENDIAGDVIGLRYWITLAKYPLLSNKLEEFDYMELFKKYVNKGISYIRNIYNQDVLSENYIYDINNVEHIFFLYLDKANEIRNKDIKAYIQYLRKALKLHPVKKGIEILLDEVKRETINNNMNEVKRNEFDEYKEMFKKNINLLIQANKLEDAKILIDEYLKIVPNDVEMVEMKTKLQFNNNIYKA